MHQWAAEDTEIGAVPDRELTCQRRQSDRFLRLCEPPASPAVRTPGLYDCPLPRQKSSVCSYRWREANASKRTAWAGSVLFPSSGLQLHPRSPPDKCECDGTQVAGWPSTPCSLRRKLLLGSLAYAGTWAGPLGSRASCSSVLSQGVFCFLTAVQKAHGSMRASLPFYGRKMNCLPSSGAER